MLSVLRIRLVFAINVSDWRRSITIKYNLFELVLLWRSVPGQSKAGDPSHR